MCKLNVKRLYMKRHKINCSGNKGRRRTIGEKKFLNPGKEVLSVYQRHRSTLKEHLLTP